MELLASGLASHVYAIDDRTVLRRSRFGADTVPEARIMRHVRTHGFPAPEVHDARGVDLVMERLYGPTLGEALRTGSVEPAEAAAIQLDLHERLHRIPAPDWLDTAPRGVDLADGRSPTAVLHLDLHPLNIVLTDAGPCLVDWANAAAGDPRADLAVSWAILAGVDLVGLGFDAATAETARSALMDPLRDGIPESIMDAAVRYRRADPNVGDDEWRRLQARLVR